MVVRFAYDFNDQQLEEIARAIDGARKRRKGAKPRKASRKECLGLIEGALKSRLAELSRFDPLPAGREQLAPLSVLGAEKPEDEITEGDDIGARLSDELKRNAARRERFAAQTEKLGPKERKAREAENLDRAHRSIVPVEDEQRLKASSSPDDPPCLRRGCGAPKSKHSKFRQCPGKRAQIGVFDIE